MHMQQHPACPRERDAAHGGSYACHMRLEVGEVVGLIVHLGEDGEPLEAMGEVVRITGDGHRGVHITEIQEPDRERLVHYVFERQRAAPRVKLQ